MDTEFYMYLSYAGKYINCNDNGIHSLDDEPLTKFKYSLNKYERFVLLFCNNTMFVFKEQPYQYLLGTIEKIVYGEAITMTMKDSDSSCKHLYIFYRNNNSYCNNNALGFVSWCKKLIYNDNGEKVVAERVIACSCDLSFILK